jgi:hypothetical protein
MVALAKSSSAQGAQGEAPCASRYREREKAVILRLSMSQASKRKSRKQKAESRNKKMTKAVMDFSFQNFNFQLLFVRETGGRYSKTE